MRQTDAGRGEGEGEIGRAPSSWRFPFTGAIRGGFISGITAAARVINITTDVPQNTECRGLSRGLSLSRVSS